MIALVTYIRGFVGVFLATAYTMILSILTIAFCAFGFLKVGDAIIHLWGWGLLRLFGARTRLHGTENIPKDRGVLFVFNHQSNMDIAAIHGSLSGRVRFGAKIELFKFPFFGRAMTLAGVLPIARENRSEVFKVYRAAEEKFAKGWSFCLAPEGTRQREPVIGRFKKGPFLFAINAKAPVVPLVIRGSYAVQNKSSLIAGRGQWRHVIDLRFLPLEETAHLSPEDSGDLMDRVRAKMVAAYEEPQKVVQVSP